MTTTNLQDLIETNQRLATEAKQRREALWVAIRDRETMGHPIPAAVGEAWEQVTATLHDSVVALAMNAPVGASVETADGTLMVATKWQQDDGVVRVTLTADGGPANRVWDESIGMCEHVRYEVYTAAGRVAHGFIAKDSRKIVQTG